jgi:hypothetical protein
MVVKHLDHLPGNVLRIDVHLRIAQAVADTRSCIRHPLHPAPLSRSCSGRGSCSGYAVLRGEKAPDDALARELGAMGLL